MGWVFKFAQSSMGAKVLMALSGFLLFGFVMVHMLGNLQIYLGPEPYNAYAHFLKSTPELLWGARLGLLSMAGLHVWMGVRLSLMNRAARPKGYVQKTYTKATFTSRAMILSGLTVLAFIVYHLAHFTLGLTDPTHYDLIDPKGYHDAYSMFVYGFQNVYVSTFYIIAMVLLGLHLEHGVSSMFQTLGLNHPRINGLTQKLGPIFAVIVVLGNISMPIAVMTGVITLPPGAA